MIWNLLQLITMSHDGIKLSLVFSKDKGEFLLRYYMYTSTLIYFIMLIVKYFDYHLTFH